MTERPRDERRDSETPSGPRYGFLKYRVRDVMSSPIVVDQQAPIRDVEALFEEHGFNAFPVVDSDGDLVGLVTSLDLLRAFAFTLETVVPRYAAAMQRPVRDIMSTELVSVRPDARLARVLEQMVASRNKSLPVLEDGRLAGIVSREDILRALRRADTNLKPMGPAGGNE